MKLRHLLAGVVALLLIPGVLWASACGCEAPDGSCSAEIECAGGCSAICASGGRCTASCSGGGGSPTPDIQYRIPASPPSRTGITLHAVDLSSTDIEALLSDVLEKGVRFAALDATQTYTLHLVDFPRDQLPGALAEFGAVTVANEPHVSRPAARGVPEAEITIRLQEVEVSSVVELLDYVLDGAEVALRIPSPDEVINLEIDRMPLRDFLRDLSAVGLIEVKERQR